MIMEYVDGSSLNQIVSKHGPLSIARAANYVKQAAHGLQHAHAAGMVHRDIKPGNLLLNRQGIVKVLDLGLAHLFRNNVSGNHTAKPAEKRMVGSDDYLAPEQIVDSDTVDRRADIYSLGATFYFMLTGKAPFEDMEVDHHKLISHVTRRPTPVRQLRTEISEALETLIQRMMAKNPWDRFQQAADVIKALEPWTLEPVPPPPADEMPELRLAARRSGTGEENSLSAAVKAPGKNSWVLGGGSSSRFIIVGNPNNSQPVPPSDSSSTPETTDAGNA